MTDGMREYWDEVEKDWRPDSDIDDGFPIAFNETAARMLIRKHPEEYDGYYIRTRLAEKELRIRELEEENARLVHNHAALADTVNALEAKGFTRKTT